MARLLSLAGSILRPFREFLFPPACLCCGACRTDTILPLCQTCLEALKPVGESDPRALDALSRLKEGTTITGFTALYWFEGGGPLQALVHGMKYAGMRNLGFLMGAALGEKIASSHPPRLPLSGIIPVPLHRAKARERGYNQSAEIARGVSGVLSLPVLAGVLERRRYTATQTLLRPEERARNVLGAFAVNARARPLVAGGRFLIVDDVVTTGATLVSCGAALMKAGAAECLSCSIALAGAE